MIDISFCFPLQSLKQRGYEVWKNQSSEDMVGVLAAMEAAQQVDDMIERSCRGEEGVLVSALAARERDGLGVLNVLYALAFLHTAVFRVNSFTILTMT